MLIREKCSFLIFEPALFYQKMLNWVKPFNIFCLLQSNTQNGNNYRNFDFIIAVNAHEILNSKQNDLSDLDKITERKDWFFGHLGYNLKNQIEPLSSEKEDPVHFDDFSFFCPEIIIYLKDQTLTIESSVKTPVEIHNEIQQQQSAIPNSKTNKPISIQSKVSKESYLEDIAALKKHIQRGDCYEINYCMEFFNNNASIDPYFLFFQLNKVSPNAFNAFYKNEDKYLICASPERYLKKMGNTIISQPIKGTIKRDIENPERDIELKSALRDHPKEQSENIMIVDLVRNDLSKICEADSVKVTELLGVYSFPQVHHLISTIEGKLVTGTRLSEIITATFPMGSMTGAPKKRVMELIEKYERSNRGIFSGAVGYIDPYGDFDFNVVIRSIFHNVQTKYLSYMVGSGITIYCKEALEYEECLLKAKAIASVIGNSI